jgi:hypothetical protein
MRNFRIVSLVLCALLLAGAGQGAGAKKKEVATVIRGEVVDLACYLFDGKRKGEAHMACAAEGINSGNPVGILTTSGELYLAIGKDLKPANPLLEPYAAKQVKVTGKKYIRGKMMGIVIDKVEEYIPPKKSRLSRSKK